tara:strand:- start:476 stop:1363 length:888 start_codon:yes stop_codon:yes gene_type:complete
MININFPITKLFESKNEELTSKSRIIFNIPKDKSEQPVSKVKVEEGFIYTLYGNNGIGKTTFMNILALLTDCEESYYAEGSNFNYGFSNLTNSDTDKRSLSRFKYFSFIFQDPHIINMYTLNENLSIVNSNFNYIDDLNYIREKITELELADYTKNFLNTKIDKFINEKDSTPYYLSGGEKQLMAFIRALIKPSNILFADEPWASMDSHLKEFIESQLYMYIHDKDIFRTIRNRNNDLSDKKVVIIISHPTQKRVHEKEYGERVEEWTKMIPVTRNKSEDVDNAQILYLEQHRAI